MSNPLYEKYKDVTAVNDNDAVATIQLQIMKLSKKNVRRFRVKDDIGGSLYLFTDNAFPDYVLEIVPGRNAENNATTLCRVHPIFGHPDALMFARRELILAIQATLAPLGADRPHMQDGKDTDVTLAERGTADLVGHLCRILT